MAAKTTFLKNRDLDRNLKGNGDFSYTFPTTVYLALFTADPGVAGDLSSEVTGGSYARQPISWGTIALGSVANLLPVVFPLATASWGTVAFAAVMDNSVGGNALYHGAVGTSKPVDTGDQVTLPAGSIVAGES